MVMMDLGKRQLLMNFPTLTVRIVKLELYRAVQANSLTYERTLGIMSNMATNVIRYCLYQEDINHRSQMEQGERNQILLWRSSYDAALHSCQAGLIKQAIYPAVSTWQVDLPPSASQ